jgi:hypothetical protein
MTTARMCRPLVQTLFVGAIGFTGAATSLSAQDVDHVDVAVGYVNVGGSMHGVDVQVSKPLTPRWSFVADFDRSVGPDCSGCEPTYRDFAGFGGVRQTWHPTTRTTPYWQLLVGGLHSTSDGYTVEPCCGLGGRFQPGQTVNYFALQPGAGVTLMLSSRFGVRGEADWQIAIPDQSEFEGAMVRPRVVVGAVLRLGGTQ